ncbi:SpoIIE family protein phosphatase [Pseudomonas sp. ML96]|uniref:SpoIIE family protein phosphatase n=1 Tax=Pseudomonas sp. ML96 TaxID=1523503 RepID=UPI0005BC53FB|nr:SpoIIE family protein phosphatase [Pseudomonas sp. ML96]
MIGQVVQFAHSVTHEAHADAVRRLVMRHLGQLSKDESLTGRITVVVQEMARNLVLHAKGGELLYYQDSERLELLAVDRGPGMSDVARCLADSYSTSGTMGAGLGAISRLSDHFDIYSQAGQGTVVFAQFRLQPAQSGPLVAAGICTPYPGEELTGDAWAINGHRMLVCDGLGHGHAAHAASSKARELFLEYDLNLPLENLLERLHRALMSTRGGAVALAEVLPEQAQVRFCGMGNVAGVLHDGRSRSMVSGNGTVGYRIGRIQSFSYPWTPSTTMILASDGISTRYDLAAYPGLAVRHPAVIAAVIHRDFRRHNDDATVVVMKHA